MAYIIHTKPKVIKRWREGGMEGDTETQTETDSLPYRQTDRQFAVPLQTMLEKKESGKYVHTHTMWEGTMAHCSTCITHRKGTQSRTHTVLEWVISLSLPPDWVR